MSDTLLLDTGLAVLLVVGTARRGSIGRHKRLSAYDEADFDTLEALVSPRRLLFTPNILTETASLSLQVGEPLRSAISGVLASMIEASREIYVASRVAARQVEYKRFGLADAAALDACGPGVTLCTADLQLYLAALRLGKDAINFRHLRDGP